MSPAVWPRSSQYTVHLFTLPDIVDTSKSRKLCKFVALLTETHQPAAAGCWQAALGSCKLFAKY